MYSMIFYFFLICLILMLMLMLNMLISKKMFKSREKLSSFECGFDPISNNRSPFSLQFYLISIIFLIFDVELALILPMICSISFYYYMININSLIIMMILLMGLYMEMYEGSLNWFK
uniref:NADH-ubiquinone oxidoreductase chain 3 n=1 Tax=Chouioia cunea TaxID=1570515 RepID=A0A8B0R548_9HYME|nr:NADH dehydrogenase subunit 3 [Chouioia cunea]QTW90611.1 NADH dehydrogenase subunit 3 [Chouioia cunea]